MMVSVLERPSKRLEPQALARPRISELVNMIEGEWTDVPKGSVKQYGNLLLQIESDNKLVALSRTGGFSGSVWMQFFVSRTGHLRPKP